VTAPVAPSDRVLAAVGVGWVRFERTRILPTYWQELALLEPVERQAVREVLRDWCVWLARDPARLDPLSTNTRHGAAR
jgi:hypothetical protein